MQFRTSVDSGKPTEKGFPTSRLLAIAPNKTSFVWIELEWNFAVFSSSAPPRKPLETQNISEKISLIVFIFFSCFSLLFYCATCQPFLSRYGNDFFRHICTINFLDSENLQFRLQNWLGGPLKMAWPVTMCESLSMSFTEVNTKRCWMDLNGN
jgi:hypothetical protein